MPAQYLALVEDFLGTTDEQVLSDLVSGDGARGFRQLSHDQITAWRQTVGLLKPILAGIINSRRDVERWGVLLEYSLPRRTERIDVVLLARESVLVLEFKVGSTTSARGSLAQVEDYALDLAHYHEASRNKVIHPIHVATASKPSKPPEPEHLVGVRPTIVVNAEELGGLLTKLARNPGNGATSSTSLQKWNDSAYKPIPGIIRAAVDLFAKHDVVDLKKARADGDVLAAAIDAIVGTVKKARDTETKVLCLVTGVPGSGKTLTGLQAIHSPELHIAKDTPPGVFLSGNGPLIRVISEALARDAATRGGMKKADAKRLARTFVASVHGFLDNHYRSGSVPSERLVVFDEAQRAWDAQKLLKMESRQRTAATQVRSTAGSLAEENTLSEPERLLHVLDRHVGWAAVVALIGTGQEIHDGEAGVAGWVGAVQGRYSHWEVYAPGNFNIEAPSGPARSLVPAAKVHRDKRLHLAVPVRAHGATELADWVDAVLSGRPNEALEAFGGCARMPIVLTRDLELARAWLRTMTRGSRRFGLIASSSSGRLRPYGIEVAAGLRKEIDYAHWFTAPRGDLRSSFALETPATEFECQGLELDLVGVCWGGDLCYSKTKHSWQLRKFRGTSWTLLKGERERSYLFNKYRVLLTRAREGMVIWVPRGDPEDPTREPKHWDDTAAYLERCGVPPLSLPDRGALD